MSDFTAINEGSIVLLIPHTEEARTWVENNLALEDWQNTQRVAIEPRYYSDIQEGIIGEGMTIERG